MKNPAVEAGFDYVHTILALREHYSYASIAEYCGYEGRASISYMLNGGVPSHPQGEALYILYFETFGKKPPVKNVQLTVPTT